MSDGAESPRRERDPSDVEILERISLPPPAGGSDLVDAGELKRRLGLESDYLAERLLAQLDADGDGKIARLELARRVEELMHGKPRAKLRFAFGVHDADGDGVIDRDELARMLHISLAENRVAFGDQMVDLVVDSIFSRADANQDGAIDFDEFAEALEHFPGVLEHMTLGDLRWLGLAEPGAHITNPPTILTEVRAVRSRLLAGVLGALYVAATVALFVVGLTGADGASTAGRVARGTGMALALHAALILLPMCRRTLTLIGRTVLGRLLVDDHVMFHQVLGVSTLLLGLVHGGAHVAAGGLSSAAGATGAGILAIHVVIAGAALARARGWGPVQGLSLAHLLAPVWVGLAVAHGPSTWMWVAGPLALWLVDRFLMGRLTKTHAKEIEILPSGVTKMTIHQPKSFDHDAGDYVFLRIPEIARFEWHPYTITSAPERKDAVVVHVRSRGRWSSALHRLAKERASETPLEVHLDGPYGTPSRRVAESKVALIVASGPGVTPFTSVIASLRWRLSKGEELGQERLHFVWACYEPRAFEWFADELGRLRASDPARFDVRVFLDVEGVESRVTKVASDTLFAGMAPEMASDLRERTTVGAPDWDTMLDEIVAEHAPIGVECFYCGPDELAATVRAACARHGVHFRQEHF